MRSCSVPGCERPFYAKSFCRFHYQRKYCKVPLGLAYRMRGPEACRDHGGKKRTPKGDWYCPSCVTLRSREWRVRNPEAYRRNYHRANLRQRLARKRLGVKLKVHDRPLKQLVLAEARVERRLKREEAARLRPTKTAYMRAWYLANREKMKALVYDWNARNPERVRVIRQTARHVRRVRIGTVHDRIGLATLADRDLNRCHLCHKPVPLRERSIDHLIPVSLGGSHTWTNVALAHHLCNSRRGNRGPAQLPLALP